MKKDMAVHTPSRLIHYIGGVVAVVTVVALFPHPAQAQATPPPQGVTVQPIFYDSENYGHTFTASIFTADTNSSSYCPGDTVTVSGNRPFTAACANGANTGVDVSINGYQLSSLNIPTCPYIGVTMCTANTVQTEQVQVCDKQICSGIGDARTCRQICINKSVQVKVCNSGASETYSSYDGEPICDNSDVENILTANPSWYVLSVDENPSNYQYSFQVDQDATPGPHSIPIELTVTASNPDNGNGFWVPVDVNPELSYTVNTPAQCQSACSIIQTAIPWGAGNKVGVGDAIQASTFNQIYDSIENIWNSAYAIGKVLSTFTGSGYFGSSVNPGNPISASQVDELQRGLTYLSNQCKVTLSSFTSVIAGTPVKSDDFNDLRTGVEAFAQQPIAESSDDQMAAFTLAGQQGVISGSSISVTVPYGTDVTALVPTITIPYDATVAPASDTAENFTNPVSYVVTAQDGTTAATYTVTVTVAPAPQGGGGGTIKNPPTPPGGGKGIKPQ